MSLKRNWIPENNDRSLWRKLFSSYVVLGLLILAVSSTFMYFFTHSTVQERTSLQMQSVRTLAAEKLSLYLENLKTLAIYASENIVHKGELTNLSKVLIRNLDGLSILELKSGEVTNLIGSLTLDSAVIKNAPFATFIPYYDNHFLLKTKGNESAVIWIFDHQGFNELLSQRTGLGKTGETYLVGEDLKIKSASRFNSDWKNISVNNESVKRARRNEEGVHQVIDYRGESVISSYAPFHFDQLKFILLSEIDSSEVLKPINTVFRQVVLISTILLLMSLTYAFFTTRNVTRLMSGMKKEINNLHFKILRTQEDERQRISLNLHDGASQYLSALKWKLSSLGPAIPGTTELNGLCNEALKEIRNVSDELMPSSMKEFGCFVAMKVFLNRQTEYLRLQIDYSYDERLSEMDYIIGFDENVFRIVQELVQNTLKHAEASHVYLNFHLEGKQLLMEYQDDGKGMDEGAPLPWSVNFRANLLGGQLKRIPGNMRLTFQIAFNMESILNHGKT